MSTALVAPDTAVEEVSAEVAEVVQRAQAMEVRTPDEARAATAFLVELKGARTRGENARKKLVKPLDDHVAMINKTFKDRIGPLALADELVRARLTAYTVEEERKAAEEQRRIDAERRERERVAEEERRAAAQEAARVEREAREAEERRQAQLLGVERERAREIAVMSDEEIAGLAAGGDLDGRLAQQEIESRAATRAAQERAENARREAEESTQRSIAEASAPAEVVTTTKLASGGGSANVRKEWKATIEDSSLVPRQYLEIDFKAINGAIREGVREIPGVRIEQVAALSVRAGR